MAIVHSIDLNLRDFRVPAVLHMTQGDAGGQRIISANLFDGSAAYTVPTGAKVMFRYSKKDHTGGMYDKDELNHSISVNGSVVQIPVAAAVLTVSGRVEAEVDIYTNNNKERVAAFPFFIECEKSAYSDGAITKSEYYKAAFDGESAYDYAKSKGYTGTEEEFSTLMASLASSESDILETKKKIDFIFDPTFSNLLQVYGYSVPRRQIGNALFEVNRDASTVTATGDTIAATRFIDILPVMALPYGIKPLDKYSISVEHVDGSTRTGAFYVKFQYYNDSGDSVKDDTNVFMGSSKDVEIPFDCTKIRIRFQVISGVTIDDHVTCRISLKKIVETFDNVTYSVPYNARATTRIADGTDYDNLTTPGCYYRDSSTGSSTLAHCPSSYGHRLMVIQTTAGPGRIQQILVEAYSSTFSKIYVRDKYGDSRDWTNWERIALSSELDVITSSIQTESARVNNEISRLDGDIAFNTNRIAAVNQLISETNTKIDMLKNPDSDLLGLYFTGNTTQTNNGIEYTYDRNTSTVRLRVVGTRSGNSYFTLISNQDIPKWFGKTSRYLMSIEMDGEFQSSTSCLQIVETTSDSSANIETTIRKDAIYQLNANANKVLIRLRIALSEPISENFSVTIKMTEYLNYVAYELLGASTLIPDGTNYDSIMTPGSYRCSGVDSAGTMDHCPVPCGHRMYVTQMLGSSQYIRQEIITGHELYHDVYSRKHTTRGWTDWHYMVHDGDVAELASRIANIESILQSRLGSL